MGNNYSDTVGTGTDELILLDHLPEHEIERDDGRCEHLPGDRDLDVLYRPYCRIPSDEHLLFQEIPCSGEGMRACRFHRAPDHRDGEGVIRRNRTWSMLHRMLPSAW